MKQAGLLILFIFFCLTGTSQYRDTVWTVRGPVILDNHFKKWKPDFVLDARRSTVDQNAARIFGLRIGAEFRRVNRFGLGLYGVSTEVPGTRFDQIGPSVDSASFNLSYVSIFYERVLLLHRKWEWSGTIHLGNGNVGVNYFLDDDPTLHQLEPIPVRPLELSTSGYYHVTWWLSVGGGVGYRFMRKSPAEIRDAYTGGLYLAKVKFRMAKLVRRIWDKSVRDEY